MKAILTLNSTDLNEEDLQRVARDLSAAMNQEVDFTAELAREGAGTQTKGEIITIGTIILTLIGSGGVVAGLIKVWKSYIERGYHLEIEVKAENGASMTVKADNLRPNQLEATTNQLVKILEDSK